MSEKTKATSEWHLFIEADDGSGRFGGVIVEGRRVQGYWFSPDSTEAGLWWAQRQDAGGAFPWEHRYAVRPFAPASCTCKGWRFAGHCRHLFVLREVLKARLTPAGQVGAA